MLCVREIADHAVSLSHLIHETHAIVATSKHSISLRAWRVLLIICLEPCSNQGQWM